MAPSDGQIKDAKRRVAQFSVPDAAVPVEIREHPVKGRCVHTTTHLHTGDFVCEYGGILLKARDAHIQEEVYASAAAPNSGWYMFYFVHKNQTFWFFCSFAKM
jgi:hypothetical protein